MARNVRSAWGPSSVAGSPIDRFATPWCLFSPVVYRLSHSPCSLSMPASPPSRPAFGVAELVTAPERPSYISTQGPSSCCNSIIHFPHPPWNITQNPIMAPPFLIHLPAWMLVCGGSYLSAIPPSSGLRGVGGSRNGRKPYLINTSYDYFSTYIAWGLFYFSFAFYPASSEVSKKPVRSIYLISLLRP